MPTHRVLRGQEDISLFEAWPPGREQLGGTSGKIKAPKSCRVGNMYGLVGTRDTLSAGAPELKQEEKYGAGWGNRWGGDTESAPAPGFSLSKIWPRCTAHRLVLNTSPLPPEFTVYLTLLGQLQTWLPLGEG